MHPTADRRTALVTGANRGIGLAAATGLAELGHRVYLSARRLVDAHDAAEALRARGLDVQAVELDVASPSSIAAAIATISASGAHIDILVNNAGVLYHTRILDMPESEIEASVSVHLTGPIRLIQQLAPAMIERAFGRIVNVSSGWGSFGQGMGGPDLYGVTKAALNALTVRLSRELPPTVKVNALCPGSVRTRMGGPDSDRSPEEGAATILWLATLTEDGPTGGFFRDRLPIEW
jgi:NAD(P)-dependent dehydrogenase (short-subunit alcohol dehydrogenase family)